MKNLKPINYILAFALLTLTACNSDDSTENTAVTSESAEGITMTLKTSGGSETEYIVNGGDILNGAVGSSGVGIEQDGWRYFYSVGKTVFSSGYSEDNRCIGYRANENGFIERKGEFVFDNALEVFGESEDDKTLLAMEIPRVGFSNKKLYIIDVETIEIKEKIETPIFKNEETGQVAFPTALKVRGDKLFIPYQVLDSEGNFTTPDANRAYIAVYPYPNVGLEPEKIISDDRTCNIGVNGITTGLIEAEGGDLYSFSCGAVSAGFSPAAAKPSGILKIKGGTTEFDKDYFFDIEAATNGGEIFWFDYVGNNKALARILTNDTGLAWDAYTRSETAFNQKLVIIDLVAKTVTDVANVPLHAKRYTSPLLVEDGKTYVSIETATDAYVYQIDIEAATGLKGAEIVGKTIKGFYRLQ